MPEPVSPLEEMLARLESLEADTRLEALEGLRRYATTRKVGQAVFQLRNDSDRRVRLLARTILDEVEQRTSESLTVQGHEHQEHEEELKELLAMLQAQDPTDRVTALKELRTVQDPRAFAAVDRMRKDPHRIVRMLAEEAVANRKVEERATRSSFEGNVMVASPAAAPRGKADWREQAVSKLGPALVPFLGALYVAIGLPFAVGFLWLWLGKQGVLDSAAFASLPRPKPEHFALVQARLRVPPDALSLAVGFAAGAFQTFGGIGLLLRHETGRKAVLLFHAILFLFGLLLTGVYAKFAPGTVSVIIVYYLTRPAIVRAFKGAAAPAAGPQEQYGDMERKVW